MTKLYLEIESQVPFLVRQRILHTATIFLLLFSFFHFGQVSYLGGKKVKVFEAEQGDVIIGYTVVT